MDSEQENQAPVALDAAGCQAAQERLRLKAEKKARKAQRAARAQDPEHVASKAEMIEKGERALEEERERERARIAWNEKFRVWCRRRAMDEVDTDGEEY